ncbi:MAG TPA: ABC transporter permease [Planctomycetaceae bacterium]|jgi:lipopolysaccharide transport system permease protein|nr:ABC transporter permease [Planctomycetaceae bacterium]
MSASTITDEPEATAASPVTRLENPSAPAITRTVIEPRSGWQLVDFAQLWRYRELLGFLAWRDVKVRYKQTVLGAAWAVLQPVLTMLVFTIFFGRFGGMSHNVSGAYPVFVFAALLPWQLFATAVTQAGQSLITSNNLISKVYFPRLIIPFSSVGTGVVDFAVSLVVMFGLMAWYRVAFSPSLLLVPVFFLGTVLTSLGVGTLLAALVIAYRDFRYVLTFLVQIWMFASPVAYPLSVVPERYRLWYALNPMVGMISGFRSALLGEPMPWGCVAVSTAAMLGSVFVGLLYFRRSERRFADII